jgi:hypothetical protein
MGVFCLLYTCLLPVLSTTLLLDIANLRVYYPGADILQGVTDARPTCTGVIQVVTCLSLQGKVLLFVVYMISLLVS